MNCSPKGRASGVTEGFLCLGIRKNHIIPILCLQVFKLCYGVSKHTQVLLIHVSEIKLILVKEMPVRTLDPFMVIGEQRIHLFHPASHALEQR